MAKTGGLWGAWKTLRKGSPVLVRMGLSFAVLVIAVAMALSLASFLFFQQKYDQELENLHHLLLDNTEREIRNEVLDVAKGVYMTLSVDVIAPYGVYFSAEDSAEGNAEKLFVTYNHLKELVNRHSPSVSAIHLYYHRSQIYLSSRGGVKYPTDSAEFLLGRSWRDKLIAGNTNGLWLGTQDETVTDIQGFPVLAEPAGSEVIVAIEFRREFLSAILDRFTSQGTGTTLLVDPSGALVAAGLGGEVGDRNRLRSILERFRSGDTSGSILSVGGVSSLVTVVPVQGADWYLVNAAALGELHRKDAEILIVLATIFLVVVLLGLGGAVPLVFRIYSPLVALIGRVKRVLGGTVRTDDTGDEYRIIDTAIEGLATTVLASKPVLQHEFVTRLLEGANLEPADFDETSRLLELKPFPGTCVAVHLRLLGGGWVSKYRLLEELQKEGAPIWLMTPLPGRDLGMIADAASRERLAEAGRRWVNLARKICGTDSCVCFGRGVSSPLDLVQSFAEARRLAEHRFFYPELSVFLDREDLLQDRGSLVLDEAILRSLTEAMRTRTLPKVTDALDAVGRFVRLPGVTAERGRHELYRVTRIISKNVSESRVSTVAELLQRLDSLLAEAADAMEWRSSISFLIADLFAQIENRTDDRNQVLIERVQSYVREHLAGELSLDKVSAAVSISTSYLSKLYKEVTGINFVAFVNEERIKEAQRLLHQSRVTIQEIGKLVGFNTPAYFIHQFRARLGVTPNEYRRNRPPNP